MILLIQGVQEVIFIFDTPFFSGPGSWILISFDVVTGERIRFLVYNQDAINV